MSEAARNSDAPDGETDAPETDRRTHELPANDVDPGADSQPDPDGHGPLSEGKDGQLFG